MLGLSSTTHMESSTWSLIIPQTNYLPMYTASYPLLAKQQKPPGINGIITRTASASSWSAGTGLVTLTVPAVPDYVGTVVPIIVAGFTPAAYNGSYQGTIASATTITYPFGSNPGASSLQGTVSYPGVTPLTILTTVSGGDVPNKHTYNAGTIQLAEIMAAEAEEFDKARAEAAEATTSEETTEEAEDESEEEAEDESEEEVEEDD